MMTLLSDAEACSVTGFLRRIVTRVSFLPISTASSAVTDVMPAGRVVGMLRSAGRVVSVRSMTNTSGKGLYEV